MKLHLSFFVIVGAFIFLLRSLWGFPGDSVVKNLPANAGDIGSIPGPGRFLEKEMATHSGILALKSPWTEEPGKLQSMGSQRSQTQLSTEQQEEASDYLKVPKTSFYIIILI